MSYEWRCERDARVLAYRFGIVCFHRTLSYLRDDGMIFSTHQYYLPKGRFPPSRFRRRLLPATFLLRLLL